MNRLNCFFLEKKIDKIFAGIKLGNLLNADWAACILLTAYTLFRETLNGWTPLLGLTSPVLKVLFVKEMHRFNFSSTIQQLFGIVIIFNQFSMTMRQIKLGFDGGRDCLKGNWMVNQLWFSIVVNFSFTTIGKLIDDWIWTVAHWRWFRWWKNRDIKVTA